MQCPQCQYRFGFKQFCALHPLKEFDCPNCQMPIIMDRITRTVCVVSLGMVFTSFFFTFPAMYEVIESQPGKVRPYIVDLCLPYIVIVSQVVLLLLPAGLYAWLFGRLRIIKRKG